MSTTQQQQQETKTAPTPLDSLLDRPVTYRPVGNAESITLTARQVIDYLCVRTRSGKAAGRADIVKFMQLCRLRGLDPWQGDAYLIGYDSQDGPQFSLITSVQALLKRAESHEQFDGLEAGVIVYRKGDSQERQGEIVLHGETLVGAWCRVYRKDNRIPFYKAINASAYNKGRSLWKSDPAGMLVKCAKAGCLRDAFPNSLGGLYVTGEINEDNYTTSQQRTSDTLVDTESDDPLDAVADQLDQNVSDNESIDAQDDTEREFELQSAFDNCESITECQQLAESLGTDDRLVSLVSQARMDTIRASRGGGKNR